MVVREMERLDLSLGSKEEDKEFVRKNAGTREWSRLLGEEAANLNEKKEQLSQE